MNKNFLDEEASWDYAEIWDKFPVPARPSKEELVYLKKELEEKNKDINLLILGSTVEYRKLCKDLGIVPFVADFDRENYEKLTSYSKENLNNEHFLEMDWLEINDVEKYDVILGHRPYNVIGKSVLSDFFEKMYQALKHNGVFYCKGNVEINTNEQKLDELVEKWAFAKNREYPLFSYLEVELYFKNADKNGYVDYDSARNMVQEWLDNKKISNNDYELIKLLISMSKSARFRGKISQSELEKVIKDGGFGLVEYIYFDKEICSNMPIIKLIRTK